MSVGLAGVGLLGSLCCRGFGLRPGSPDPGGCLQCLMVLRFRFGLGDPERHAGFWVFVLVPARVGGLVPALVDILRGRQWPWWCAYSPGRPCCVFAFLNRAGATWLAMLFGTTHPNLAKKRIQWMTTLGAKRGDWSYPSVEDELTDRFIRSIIVKFY
ncbi:hypothetical protein TcWFU_000545 [Taenia crassiceps]|uniref:Uncharacterized protein n=1 Tax=Taenia crassiceps TaxID=6207 RepID=A0ABR4Q8Y4_9CEST